MDSYGTLGGSDIELHATLFDSDDADFGLNGARAFTSFTLNGETYLVVAASFDRSMLLRMNDDGSLDDVAYFVSEPGEPNLDEITDVTSVVIGGNVYVLFADFDERGVMAFRVNSDGSVDYRSAVTDVEFEREELGGGTGIATATIDGETFILSSRGALNGITSLSLDGNGTLAIADLQTNNGQTVSFEDNHLAVGQVGDTVFVFATQGAEDAVNVYELSPSGELSLVFTLQDTGNTALNGAVGVEVVAVGDQLILYVAGYADDGVSAFRVQSDGSLTHISTITDTSEMALGGAVGLRAAILDGDHYLFVSGIDEDGVSAFAIGSNGSLSHEATIFDSAELALDGAYGLEVFASPDGSTSYLAVAGFDEDGISLFNLNSVFSEVETAVEGEDDRIVGGTRDDTLLGGEGDDTLFGNLGDDLINGGNGDDSIQGGVGDDTLFGGRGSDTLTGGDGADIFRMSSSDIVTDFEDGVDLIELVDNERTSFDDLDFTQTGENMYFLDNLGNIMILRGVNVSDISAADFVGLVTGQTLAGTDGADTLTGAEGNDTLVGGSGADRLTGGDGTDTADYSASSAGVSIDLANGTASGGDAEGDQLLQIENVAGSAESDALTGDAADNALSGNAGDDTINGGNGSDTLNGGEGDDSLFGGQQPDLLVGGSGRDTLKGSNGADTLAGGTSFDDLSGGNGNDLLQGDGAGDRLRGDPGADTLDGGAGPTDQAYYFFSNDAVNIDLEAGTASGGYAEGDVLLNIESVIGSTGDDTLAGLEAGSRLVGAGGDDLLTGRSGDDRIEGGNGNDTIIGGAGADILNGGRGTDLVDYAASPAAVNVNLATRTGSGGDAEGDRIGAIQNVRGSAFDDVIVGNQAPNQLSGGVGDDTLTGGAGADTFVFTSGGGDDVVTDFDAGSDMLDLSATGAGFASLADVLAAAVETIQGADSGLLIDTGGGNSVFLINVSLDDLSANNLVL